jgi:DNA-binding transcriptional LysR family regulator
VGSLSVDELQLMNAIARGGSLTAASRELGRSLPVVSKRLAAIENRLGVCLVRRSTRKLTLTEEGEMLAARAERILDDIADLEDEVSASSSELKGHITVRASLGIGRHHVSSIIADFTAEHPDVAIQLDTSALPLAATPNFDVAVHVGQPADSNLTLRRVARNRRVVCAAPSYLAAFGEPTSIDELRSHNCIVLRENDGDYALWRFGETGHEYGVRVDGSLASNDGDVVTKWALAGRGLIQRSTWHVGTYLRSGELEQVLPDVQVPSADIYALFHDERHTTRRVRAFVNYLAAELPTRVGD